MRNTCQIRIAEDQHENLFSHLFPGDDDEHGAIALAGLLDRQEGPILTIRELYFAEEGSDYVHGKIGYRALDPMFIHRLITRARDQRLVYLAIHNHFSDRYVGFSQIDLESHERGYPALLQISKGMPVGALVCGRRSMQADLWMPDGRRMSLEHCSVVGKSIRHLEPSSRLGDKFEQTYERQVRWFGRVGQDKLRQCKVAVIGLGGIGSLVSEYLARVGVGKFLLIDGDVVEESNLSRIVGASREDALGQSRKVEVARRLIRQANPGAEIELICDDVAKKSVAKKLTTCDYLFLAADSMRARLVFNAVIHQYLIPGVQLGAKIRAANDGAILDVMSVNRPIRPGYGCLWCNELIDSTLLAKEAKTDEERKDQAYGVEEPNPSVISLNAISASHAVNDFLLDYLDLRKRSDLYYEHFHFLSDKRMLVSPTKDPDCPECSVQGVRFAQGDSFPLPCIEG
jgi:hypothetical protein